MVTAASCLPGGFTILYSVRLKAMEDFIPPLPHLTSLLIFSCCQNKVMELDDISPGSF